MPYISRDRALPIGQGLSLTDTEQLPKSKGELNYAITTVMVRYLKVHGKSYQNISDVIAAAQDAADEMKRRVLAPYEDDKRFDPNNIDPYQDL